MPRSAEAQDFCRRSRRRVCPLTIHSGSKLPARSRGTNMSILPSSVRIVFALVPLRLLPLPRPGPSSPSQDDRSAHILSDILWPRFLSGSQNRQSEISSNSAHQPTRDRKQARLLEMVCVSPCFRSALPWCWPIDATNVKQTFLPRTGCVDGFSFE